ncbi:MAG: CBS domain-containing protein [Nitrospirota bacterium]
MSKKIKKMDIPFDLTISDEDIYAAMKNIPGYLDITTGDFKELYRLTYRHAVKRIAQSVKAADIMTEEVVTAKRGTPLKEVAKVMAEQGVSGVPVIEEDKKVAGVISEKDFLSRMDGKTGKTFMGVVAKCLKGKACVAIPIRAKKAEDIMTSPAITVKEDSTLRDIADLFKERKINRVPVVDVNGCLIGIVSREDIIESPLLRDMS